MFDSINYKSFFVYFIVVSHRLSFRLDYLIKKIEQLIFFKSIEMILSRSNVTMLYRTFFCKEQIFL